MALGLDRPRSGQEKAPAIGGSSRYIPGMSHDQITVVNGKVRLARRCKDLWTNRDLLVLLTRTQLKVKYKSSVLGYAWSMLNPALVLAIYFVVFSIISKSGQPHFAIWIMAGLLPWNLFNGSAIASTGVVVQNSGIVKKVAFPRELLALSTVGVAMVMFVLQSVVLVIAMVIFQITPNLHFLILLPLAMVALLIFTGAMSILLSAINVYLRDTQHLTEVALMAWFWSIPIIYSYELIAEKVAGHSSLIWIKWAYLCDPITPIVMTFQRAIYSNTSYLYEGKVHKLLPAWGLGPYAELLVVIIVASIGLFLLAMVIFGRLEGNFAEEL